MHPILWFLLFFLPAYVANMAPVFVRHTKFLAYPLDGGLKLGGERLLGANKTVRGLLFGTFMGGITGAVLQLFALPITWKIGLLVGFAALLGDAVKSFFKRRIGIRPGGTWIPFDQLDFLIFAYGAAWLVGERFTWQVTLIGFILVLAGNLLVQFIGGRSGLKADKL